MYAVLHATHTRAHTLKRGFLLLFILGQSLFGASRWGVSRLLVNFPAGVSGFLCFLLCAKVTLSQDLLVPAHATINEATLV